MKGLPLKENVASFLMLFIVGTFFPDCVVPELVGENNESPAKQEVSVSELDRTRREGVKVIESYSFYGVAPASREALIQSLIDASPIKRNGRGYLAETGIWFRWTLDWLTDSKTCWVNKAHVELHVTFLLPKLLVEIADVDMIWSDWFPRLLKHEHNHRDIGLAIAYEMKEKLAGLGPEAECESIIKKASILVAELERKEEELHEDYDKKTNHGETEGLIFTTSIGNNDQLNGGVVGGSR